MKIIGVLTRQLGNNNPVTTSVVTEEEINKLCHSQGLFIDERNSLNIMASVLEDKRQEFIKKFPEFREARWGSDILEIE